MTKTTQNDTRIALLEQRIDQYSAYQKEIKESINSLSDKMDQFIQAKLDKDEFTYWRNILVSGILLSILFVSLNILGRLGAK